MNRKLKRTIGFYLISGIVITAPVIFSIVMAMIGATYWNWGGRAVLAVLAGVILSVSLLVCFLALIDDHGNDIRSWMQEPEVEKNAPKAGAWKEKD